MTARLIVRPVYAMECDVDGCDEEVRDSFEYTLKDKARNAGWQLRPGRGKGSRTAPDLCPQHRTDGGEPR